MVCDFLCFSLSLSLRPLTLVLASVVPVNSVLAPILANGDMYSTSIKMVDDWIKETMLKMKEEIRWRQSGINRDSGEPLYEIRNPNIVIDRLLSR